MSFKNIEKRKGERDSPWKTPAVGENINDSLQDLSLTQHELHMFVKYKSTSCSLQGHFSKLLSSKEDLTQSFSIRKIA